MVPTQKEEREQTTSQGECLQLVEFLSHSFFFW